MTSPLHTLVQRELAQVDTNDSSFAVRLVDRILDAGRQYGASDLHFQPTASGLELRLRVDGVLHTAGEFPPSVASNIVTRLKVLGQLLTYRTDVPQEGRIRREEDDIELRISTFPTLHGERAVVRLFAGAGHYRLLGDLGLPEDVLDEMRRLLGETSGAVLVTGPAGSGKTTTVYACLRELVSSSGAGRCLVSIEDPIEVAVEGVAQSQVNTTVDLDLGAGLRFLMRQDPEVILVGEIRDRSTAEAALQASLTGHLLLSTFHAGSATEAIGRLSDMGIEPYLLRSGVLGILSLRLVRRLCQCSQATRDVDARLGLPLEEVHIPVGCPQCDGSGYQGRFLLAEMLTPGRTELGRAILSRSDSATLEQLAVEAGMITRWRRAIDAVGDGRTSPAEVRRVLGVGNVPSG